MTVSAWNFFNDGILCERAIQLLKILMPKSWHYLVICSMSACNLLNGGSDAYR